MDGKQRLESIWQFIDGEFALADDFSYLADPKLDLAGLNYAELGRSFPKLKMRFDGYPLPIMVVTTNDVELIEDMFSRLNEAVPLNAPEKRNAFGGPLPSAIRRLARHEFFKKRLPYGNRRFRHYDLAAKLLLIEDSDAIADTKKAYLDAVVKEWSKNDRGSTNALMAKCRRVLSVMAGVFVDSDPLLASVGMNTVYYHVFRMALSEGWVFDVRRDKFTAFNKLRLKNRKTAEEDIAKAQYDLLEFDAQMQSPNDAAATEFKVDVLLDHVFSRELVDVESPATTDEN